MAERKSGGYPHSNRRAKGWRKRLGVEPKRFRPSYLLPKHLRPRSNLRSSDLAHYRSAARDIAPVGPSNLLTVLPPERERSTHAGATVPRRRRLPWSVILV